MSERLTLGIDIGGTNTEFGIVNKNGEILSEGKIETKKYKKFDDYLNYLSENILKLIENNSNIIGVGVGAPNANYYNGTIEQAPNLTWEGIIPFSKKLGEKLHLPVVLTNDANAATIGEMIYGGAKNMKNFVVITLGTGVGSGIVVNGELVYGHDGFAGEIGHSIVIPEGRKCACGRDGCIEAYACASGIKLTARELLQKTNIESKLRTLDSQHLSSKDIASAAESGDKLALEVFNLTGKMLGLKLSDTVAHLSPEAIFIFGGVAKAGDILLGPIQKYLDHFTLNILKGKTKILASQIPGEKAAILGASALAWKEFSK
jgi:glucokinase